MRILFVFYVLLVFTFTLSANIINIPNDYSSIQLGIDASVDGDTVLVQPAIYSEGINFNGKNIIVASLFLTTADSSYIDNTLIEGGTINTCAVFENGEDSTAALIGFTLFKGYSQLNGGGVRIENSSPTLSHLIIQYNYSLVSGGGMYINNSTSRLNDIEFFSNNSPDGAGAFICANSNIEMSNISFLQNFASNSGGGIYSDASYLTVNSAIFEKNFSDNTGGGLYLCNNSVLTLDDALINENIGNYHGGSGVCSYDSSVNISNSCFILNTTNQGSGGAMLLVNSTTDIFNTGFDDNQAHSGGAITAHGGTFNSSENSYQHNSARNSGALSIIASSTASFIRDEIFENSALLDAGVCVDSSIATFSYCGFLSNSALGVDFDGSKTGQTGALGVRNYSDVTIDNSLFNSNFSFKDGAIAVFLSVLEITDTEISSNDTGENSIGGAMRIDYLSDVIINNCEIYNNRASQGGALYVNQSNLTVNNANIFENYAESDSIDNISNCGGGMYVTNSCNVSINGGDIYKNRSSEHGGALYIENSTYHVNDVLFGLNNAGYKGGVMYMSNCSNSAIYGSVIEHNCADTAAVMYITDNTDIKIINCDIHQNASGANNSIIYCNNGAVPDFTGCLIYDNSYSNPAIIFLTDDCMSKITNCTIVYNDQVAVSTLSTEVDIKNCIVWQNAAPNIIGNPAVTFSCVQDAYTGTGNINTIPGFVDIAANDYRLVSGSPCIDTGCPDTTGLSLPVLDIDGNFRIFDGDVDPSVVIDMGAYEYTIPIINTHDDSPVPEKTALTNYPNPFNPETSIEFSLPHSSQVNLTVYNIKGQKVTTLINEHRDKGEHKTVWKGTDANGEPVSSGVYFFKLLTDKESLIRKSILLK